MRLRYRGTLTTLDDVSRYFDTLLIWLKRGRVFNDLDKKETTPVAVITKRCLSLGEVCVGKRFTFLVKRN
jgi:hypothetical protein